MGFEQWLLVIIGGISSAVVGSIYVLQEKLIYHPSIPSREHIETPSDYAMRYEDVNFTSEDGVTLHGWLVLQPRGMAGTAATVVYFHGNAGNISHRLRDVREFVTRGHNVLMVSYRGYGLSRGSPSESGLRKDAMAAISYIKDRSDIIDTNRLFLFGRSIGGAVAISAASQLEEGALKGVIVENSFTSLDDMIDVVLPILKPFKFLNRNKWTSLQRIQSLKTPLLFISGLRDELCPPIHMRRLYEAATASRLREMHTVPEGSHNDTWYYGGERYRDAIDNFIRKARASFSR